MDNKKQKPETISLDIKFENFGEVDNEGFVRGECKIAYAGKNRNYTNISKKAFERAEKSLFNIPVVGNWLSEIELFGGHDAVLEKRGNKLEIKDTTVPYGVVPESGNPRWVDVEDEYGNVKKYYTTDVVLWYERYPEQVQSVMDGKTGQSMEIMLKDAEWDENYEYLNIDDFYFSALCLLGRDEEGNTVIPCFEDSEVTTYSFEGNKKFTAQLDEMLNKFSNISTDKTEGEGGDKDMDKDGKTKVNAETKNIKNKNIKADDNNTEKSIDFKLKYENLTSNFNSLNKTHEDLIFKYEELKGDYAKLEDTVNELKSYKQNIENEKIKAEKESLFTKFSKVLSDEDIQEIKDNMDDYSVDEINNQLISTYGNKKLAEELDKFNKEKMNKDDIGSMENFNKKNEKSTDDEEVKKNEFAL